MIKLQFSDTKFYQKAAIKLGIDTLDFQSHNLLNEAKSMKVRSFKDLFKQMDLLLQASIKIKLAKSLRKELHGKI